MKKFTRITALLTAAATALCLCSCTLENNPQTDSTKLKIISTVFPPYDLAKQIAGDNADISILLPPGSESHTYEPTAKEILEIQNCDIFLYIGGENEQWAEKIISSNKSDSVKTVKLIDCVKTLKESDLHEDEEEHHEEHGHETDEHIWTSPKNEQLMLTAVYDAICEADPENKAVYTKNKDSYNEQLSELDKAYKEAIDNAKNKTIIIADKFPFRYLAEEYGLDCYAAFSSCSDESEPSAAAMTSLISTIKERNIPVVYYLEFSSTKVADTLCSETGASSLMLHSCHNVSKEDLEKGISYVDLMKQNLENLKTALNG
ncbi:MAG: metal ABC transporter substrate-binding protein [Ruminiclostridium sp.]